MTGLNARWRTARCRTEDYCGDRSVSSIASGRRFDPFINFEGTFMNTIIYIVGLIVVIGFVLSFFGLR